MENAPVNQTPANPLPPVPNSTAVLVLGILSIVGCWCYGLPGIILGIIALVLGSKAKALYKNNPSQYSVGSSKNLNAGYICAIIGTCLSGICILVILAEIIFFGAALGTLFSTMPWDALSH